MAPNLLAVTLAAKVAGVSISWTDWFVGFRPDRHPAACGPASRALQALSPADHDGARGARAGRATQLREMGPISRREATLLVLVLHCAGALDRRRKLHRSDDGGDDGRGADGRPPGRDVGAGDRSRRGVERARLVCGRCGARRRSCGNRIRQVDGGLDRARARGPRRLPDDRQPRRRVLLHPLLLCEHHRAHGHALRDIPGGWRCRPAPRRRRRGRCCSRTRWAS